MCILMVGFLCIYSFNYLSVCLFIFVQTISASLHHGLVVAEFMLCLLTGRIGRVAFISSHQTVCQLSQRQTKVLLKTMKALL